MKIPASTIRALDLHRPTLLLDPGKARSNIDRMVERAHAAGVRFRPHFKTHQSAEIGSWFRSAGIDCITVSSLDMAHYFAQHDWTDITLAFPVNILEIDKINALARSIRLHLIVDALETIETLDADLQSQLDVWVKVDLGAHRVGVLWADFDRIHALAQALERSHQMRFAGLLAHSGHSYAARSRAAILRIHEESLSHLAAIRERLIEHGMSACEISIGDTPCCSLAEHFLGADEIRPGNFVFFDLMQCQIGACSPQDIAVAVACPVVSLQRTRGQIVIYGGAVHLGKDSIEEDGKRIFGRVGLFEDGAWTGLLPGAAVVSVSQEHGVLDLDDACFEDISIGDVLAILPVHSCLTADLFSHYRTLTGDRISRRQSNECA